MSEESAGPREDALTRRKLVERSLAAAGALGLGSLAAACGAGEEAGSAEANPAAPAETASFAGPLRVLGIGTEDPLKDAAEKDLGFGLVLDVVDPLTLAQRVETQPDSFDVVDIFSHFDSLWSTGNLQPLEIARIDRWGEVSPLVKYGKIGSAAERCTYGEGDAPFRKLYIDPAQTGTWKSSPDTVPTLDGIMVEWVDEASGQVVGDEPRFCSSAPGLIGMDSVGYNSDVAQLEPEEVSWVELLNPKWRGRVALANFPDINMIEVGIAARKLGLMTFGNLGNPTRDEIDGFLKLLLELQKKEHFRAFWSDPIRSLELMSSGEVVVESMWYPIVATLQAQGFPVRYAAPAEGYRGWSQGIALSATVTDPATLQACYDYINWWYSGPAGAIMMRTGYYTAVQETSRAFAEPGEYAYWIEGRPADKDYAGPFGEVSLRKGHVREGGSFEQRACRVSAWNSIFDEGPYLFERWAELVAPLS